MKNYSVVVLSSVLVFFAANALAHTQFQEQNTCDVKYHLHENLSNMLMDDVGIQVLNELRQNLRNICVDPKAHNAIIRLLDALNTVATEPNVARTLSYVFFWVKKATKNPNFRVVWHETMLGVDMLFDRSQEAGQLFEIIMDNLTAMLDDPNFDSTFGTMITQMSSLLNLRKNMLYKVGSMVVKPMAAARPPNRSNTAVYGNKR